MLGTHMGTYVGLLVTVVHRGVLFANPEFWYHVVFLFHSSFIHVFRIQVVSIFYTFVRLKGAGRGHGPIKTIIKSLSRVGFS